MAPSSDIGPGIELRHLISFLAIAEELHFGRAAARLHLAQPSLSQHLQRLERSVGVELVARNSHEVRLTPAGEAFRERAQDIVARVRRAAQAARAAAAGRAGTVRVGYNFPAGQRVLPAALATLNARHPEIDLEMSEMRTGPQLAALGEGRLDVAMVYGRPLAADLRSRHLLRVPLVAVVGLRHPWAARERVPFVELAGESCILFNRAQSSAMYDAIFSAAQTSGIRLTVAEEVDDPHATAIIAAIKPVVGFASALRGRMADGATGGPRTKTVRLYDPVPILDLYAVWRAQPGPLVEAFLSCLPASSEVTI
ncbi:DNA-binding transcriptional LysR family regulator [Thermocatellispora tengchongensis]|uniref:DNA-binding transcriptional LysR family regulator n=1 Tax=Thermocatellispora tengchongensis TaxID=1073253 RepID=A0A840PJ95_9ACTN|nr:LysR family transcriptional regulator [Thermocatellispora tengchongensis]MBB5139192.1 DNA-binding transcriptional LysR family regulator [Thermocatellispora tengchongensis]